LESLGALLPLLLLAVLGYFLLIRPTRRRAQEVSAVQHALGVGAEVMLTSGIFGTVTAIDGEQVLVEIARDVVVKVHRGAIGKIMTPAISDDDMSEFDDLSQSREDAEGDSVAGADSSDSSDTDDAADAADDVEPHDETGHDSRGAN
jgi:preprotein translocase subunit YajC